MYELILFFFFQAEDGIRDVAVTGVQTCALPICGAAAASGEMRCAAQSEIPKKRKTASFEAGKIRLEVLARAANLCPRRQPADCPGKGLALSPDQTDREPRHRQVAAAADAIAYCARRWRQNARAPLGSSAACLSAIQGQSPP